MHIAGLLITCLGARKQKIACVHAPQLHPQLFFKKMWCPQPALWSSKTRAVCHPLRCKWALWAQKWQPWHAKHVASLLITCLGPCKQKIACGHAPPLVFFQKVMPQQQRMHSTKQTATTQEMQTRCWKQQTSPLKSDEQGHGGKKKSPNPFF